MPPSPTPQRRLTPAVSSSPRQAVSEEGAGSWRARCVDCGVRSDMIGDAAAWQWVDDHLCGIETIRLP